MKELIHNYCVGEFEGHCLQYAMNEFSLEAGVNKAKGIYIGSVQ